jgi:anti-sigma regulatory factor (Ser/Thr protein kinase)
MTQTRRRDVAGPDGAAGDARLPEAAPLRARDAAVVVAGWALFAALTVGIGRLYGHRGGPPGAPPPGVEARLLVLPAMWAVLTLGVLWASRRFRLDGAFWRRRTVYVLAAGVLLANVSDAASHAVWDAMMAGDAVVAGEAARRPAGEPAVRGRRGRGGARTLTWLDDYVVFLVAVAAGTARGYVLRDRARRDAAGRREAALAAETARAQADAAQLRAQLAEARLDALRRQLDPHFLFNTLNAVSALVERDPRGVRRMVGQLSDLLRHSMDGASAPEVPLRDELALLERYADIMRVRFEDQLEIETRADPRTLDALVPNLILQPLVENAIRHGVEPRPDGGRVEVDAGLDGGTLVLRVRDDGAGASPWPPPDGAAAGRGVGLRNTAARLAQLYGAEHRLTLGPGPDGGTVAEVRLPYHTRAGGRRAARV